MTIHTVQKGMRRSISSTVLAALMLTLVVGVGGCAREGGVGDEPVVLPTGPATVVATYQISGGFVPYGWSLIEPPRLFLYADGTVVADATRQLTLTTAELSEVVASLRRDLRGLGPTVEASGGQQVADAPTTQFTVLAANGQMTSVSAYAIGIVDGYPKGLMSAHDRLDALARRVLADGTPFTSDRVRLVLTSGDQGQGTVPPWPANVELPPRTAQSPDVRTADLTGVAAARVSAALPADALTAGSWPRRQTSSGEVYQVAWRYLVPGE